MIDPGKPYIREGKITVVEAVTRQHHTIISEK
jgi:hypothetical protein